MLLPYLYVGATHQHPPRGAPYPIDVEAGPIDGIRMGPIQNNAIPTFSTPFDF